MKKLLSLALVALLVSMTYSCGNTAKGGSENDSDSVAQEEAAVTGKVDTIATRLAFLSAGQVKLGTQDSVVAKEFNNEEYIKGFEEVFKQDNSYLAGREAAEQAKLQLRQLEMQLGIKIDKDVFLKEYKRILAGNDSISIEELQKVNGELTNIFRAKAMAAQQGAAQARH